MVAQHKTRLQREAGGITHLIEVVVSQTVGKIQVRWISWNRIPTGSRIKSYIHDVRGSRAAVAVACSARSSICFCRLQSKRAGRDGERKAAKLTRALSGYARYYGKGRGEGGGETGKVLIFLFYTLFSRFISVEVHMEVGMSLGSCPSKSSRRCVPMHLHTAAAVYKEATRPASERGSTSFFFSSFSRGGVGVKKKGNSRKSGNK